MANGRTKKGRWLIRVDVGGTFTDCVSFDPNGELRVCKVLSNGALRGRVASVDGSRVRLEGEGWDERLVASVGGEVRVEGSRVGAVGGVEGETFVIDRASRSVGAGETVEIVSGEPSPIVAARIVTRTRPGEALPSCDFRFATTRATNALLERKQAPTALIVSAGFEDLLRIGDQTRPDIYAVRVVKPGTLTELVYGVPGRLGTEGEAVEALDEDAVRAALGRATSDGAEAVAVAMVNAWADGRQEARVAELAREAGFGVVARSSSVSPRIGLLGRARAVSVEASLTPVLEGYIDRVRAPLDENESGGTDGSSVSIMKSDGGLCPVEVFRPIDSLLSGPSAGVVGASSVGRSCGRERVISFDMGGTSTDVSRCEAGETGGEGLSPSHSVGGIEIARPSVDIETVAAGGGSVCGVRDGRPCVGPESAGSDPGPACYGAGGPLTVTDVNLLLGRIDIDAFEIPIDVEAARSSFGGVASELRAQGWDATDDELLSGYLELTNERMAEAIRAVSIRRGYDPSDHALVAFGGAGPQHACDVAGLLGISEVLVPREASLLSAVGLDASVMEAEAERDMLTVLDDSSLGRIAEVIESLEAEARERLEATGHTVGEVRVTARARYEGQDATIAVDASEAGRIVELFEDAHERVHGSRADRDVEVVGVRVVARAEAARREGATWEASGNGGEVANRRVHDGGAWIEAPVHERDTLGAGERVEGPSVIHEARTQTWVPVGWLVSIEADGTLRVVRTEEGGARASRSSSMARELVVHRLGAIAGQMGEALERAAVSVNVKERRDYSCGVLDREGRLVSAAAHLPVHLGALGPCVRAVIAELGELDEGDAALTNHPGFGGSHLPDLTVVQPVFDSDGTRLGYVASRAHHAEVGGLTPGSMPPDAENLGDEGVAIAPMLIATGGVFDEQAVRGVMLGHRLPTRSIGDNVSDLRAAVVAGRRAEGLIREAVARSGREAVLRAMAWINGHTSELVRARLADLEGLPASVVERMDDGREICVRVSLGGDGGLVVDFTGTTDAGAGNVNAPIAVTRSAVAYVVRLLVGASLPLNDGFLEPVEVVAPEGCLLNPMFEREADACPSVAGGNVETSQRVTEALLRALRLCAGGPGTMNNVLIGNDSFGVYETICSGAPAGADWDGADAVHQHMTNTRITDAEVLERRYPLRVREFSVRRGSGGDGAHRGGDGAVRVIEALDDVTATVLTQRRDQGPPGMEGGGDGAPGRQRVVRADGEEVVLKWAETVELCQGDRLIVETPGGGGWGRAD